MSGSFKLPKDKNGRQIKIGDLIRKQNYAANGTKSGNKYKTITEDNCPADITGWEVIDKKPEY